MLSLPLQFFKTVGGILFPFDKEILGVNNLFGSFLNKEDKKKIEIEKVESNYNCELTVCVCVCSNSLHK